MAKKPDKLYQAMRDTVADAGIKASPQHELYWTKTPYFFTAAYAWGSTENVPDGKVRILLDAQVRLWKSDELLCSILDPENPLRFGDKLRGGIAPVTEVLFDFDGTDEALPELCEDILAYIQMQLNTLLDTALQEFGGLDAYYLAHREEYSRLAGLVCLAQGDYAGAEGCFRCAIPELERIAWTVTPKTKGQRMRLQASGARKLGEQYQRTARDALLDYARAMRQNRDWEQEDAKFGLLP